MTDAPFCAEVARAVSEPLAGTASTDGLRFLLVESDDAFGRDALESSTLSEASKDALVAAVEAVPRTRLAFVRPTVQPAERALWVVGGASEATTIHRIPFASDAALGALDLPALLRGEAHAGVAIDVPVVLVCTHGKRDRCCARYGVGLASALAREPGFVTLQASHLGGHRFAAVVVTLPDRRTYGHLDEPDASALADAVRARGLFDLARFRGRAGSDVPVMVAEAELLARHGDVPMALGPVRKQDGRVFVPYALESGVSGELELQTSERPVLRPASCFEPNTPIVSARVVADHPRA